MYALLILWVSWSIPETIVCERIMHCDQSGEEHISLTRELCPGFCNPHSYKISQKNKIANVTNPHIHRRTFHRPQSLRNIFHVSHENLCSWVSPRHPTAPIIPFLITVCTVDNCTPLGTQRHIEENSLVRELFHHKLQQVITRRFGKYFSFVKIVTTFGTAFWYFSRIRTCTRSILIILEYFVAVEE